MSAEFKRTKVTARIEAVIKITERCNINCSYCYMFNRGNMDYQQHPIYISDETILATARFLAQGAKASKTKEVRIIFHGGEPMMFKKAKFIAMCDTFLREITPYANLVFAMQTNGMLVTDEWITILSKYKIGVGVSIDGPKDCHDAQRVDHKGHGTYDRVIAGLKKLQQAHEEGRISPPGGICVINTKQDARKIYHHLVNELKIKKQNFLIPMDTHDSVEPSAAEALGKYLTQIFDEWTAADDATIDVRVISQAMRFLMNGKDVVDAHEKFRKEAIVLFTIASNGDLGPDDDVKVTNVWPGGMNVANCSLFEFLNSPAMDYLQQVEFSLPDECKSCCWQNYCIGGSQNGSVVNRYSTKNGFDNPSVYCSGLKFFYGYLTTYLLKTGTPYNNLTQVLDYSNSPYWNPITPLPANLQNRRISITPIAA